jgi:3-mercaptopyruvate sulfurtransferase SseA
MFEFIHPRHFLFGLGLAISLVLGGCGKEYSDRDIVVAELAEVRKLHSASNSQFVDPRGPEEFSAAHIKGAINLPVAQVTEIKTDMDPAVARAKTVVVYGNNPGSAVARVVAKRLMAAGHKGIRLYSGGLDEWRANGLPVEAAEPKR